MAPLESETATMLAPFCVRNLTAAFPTAPKPSIAMVAFVRSRWTYSLAIWVLMITP